MSRVDGGMSREDMQAAIGAFKRGKRLLSRRKGDLKEDWICWTLNGPGARDAQYIVARSIDPYFFYSTWLDRNHPGNYSYNEIQAGRHAFVDACIAELERRLSERQP